MDRARCWLALPFAAAVMLPGAASAAEAIPTDTFTDAFAEQLFFNPATTTTSNVNTFTTQIIGQIVGGSIVYDQTFGLPYGDATVQAGQTSAIAAITTAGGPGVVIGTPVLTATNTTTSSTSVTTYSLANTSQTFATAILFGPGVVNTGQLTVCTGISSLPGATAPSCGAGTPTTYVVGDDETNFNTTTTTTYTIDTTTAVTNTTNLFEQYTISGTMAIVQAVGGEHAAAVSTLGDENQRFTQVLLSNIVSGASSSSNVQALAIPGTGTTAMGWAEGFGWKGDGKGDKRSGAGLDGGLTVNASDTVKLGFGFSHGWLDVSMDDGSGSADAELTEIGLAASWSDDGAYVGATGVAGFGKVRTSGIASSAKYDATVLSAAAEAGYNFDANGFTLTPNVGGQYTHVSTDDFTGAGAAALTSSGSSSGFGKGWLGLKARSEIEALTLSAYARLVAYSDENISLPVSFVGGGAPMSITGAERSNFGVEAGLAANYTLSSTLTAFAGYDVRVRGGSAIHAGLVGLSANW